jgi:acetyltransferase-like isoleucine patch superfamily enzyme
MRFINTLTKVRNKIRDKYYLMLFNFFERPLFNKIGRNVTVGKDTRILNHNRITIGNHFHALERFRLEAISKYGNQLFKPEIVIGDNVTINTDVHIGCIDKVHIGNNVLLASRIYIADHSHGNTDFETLQIPPNARPLVSRGPVIIEDNVWIGEGVSILPGVTIGKNSIIGANSVVTKSCKANSIMAGVPAKVIRSLLQ